MIQYVLKRIIQKFWVARTLAKHRFKPGFFLINNKPDAQGVIFFQLSDPRFVHLGDQLFYEPAMHFLESQNINFVVAPTNALTGYFQQKAFKVASPKDAASEQIRLHVLPLALYDASVSISSNALIVDFTDANITQPLGEALCDAVADALRISPDERCIDKHIAPGLHSDKNIALPANTVLFSNYVDSGRFRMRRSFFTQLETKASELKNSGHFIVHVGSKNDKKTDDRIYDFVGLDLRGETSPVDLITMFQRSEVVSAVTFDNFVMHAALMAGKPIFVKFRGRFTASAVRHHMRNVNPALAPRNSDLITYL